MDPDVEAILQRLKLYPVLAELRACLCRAMDAENSCFCGILIGDDIPAEYANCDEDAAIAYVRVITGYPSSILALQPDQVAPSGWTRTFNLAVGSLRPQPIGEGRTPPSAEEVEVATLRSLADMQLAWEAIMCCLGSDKFEDLVYLVGAYTPLPSAGGVGGGEWTVSIQDDYL